jgi:dimethylamine/trimethylamine dehydrogenase
MECAIVLAKRGMRRVHLVDGADELGGIMRWVPRLPGLGEWARVVNYRRIQIEKLKNLEFIPRTRLDADGVAEYGAEMVVIATGAPWATDGMSGWTRDLIPGADADLPHCLTPEQVMLEGKPIPGDRVVIYDCEGYYLGSALAERFAGEGKRVTLVTPNPNAGPYLSFTAELAHVSRVLHRLDVDVVTDHVLTSIEPGRVSACELSAAGRTATWEADAVVLITQRNSDDAIYHSLREDAGRLEREGVSGLYRIGDCVEPRLIADCIFDGHRLAREIDSDDPATPLPFEREKVVLTGADLTGLATA